MLSIYLSVYMFIYLGMDTEGIYHTGIVVFGQEYFFGADGIKTCQPTQFKLGTIIIQSLLIVRRLILYFFYQTIV